MALELEKIRPIPGKFTLSQTGKDYILRPFNIEDEIWLRHEFGDKLPELFNEKNVDDTALCKIAYHQLTNKQDFAKKEIVEFDFDGNKITKHIGGYRLLMSYIEGISEKIEILIAINKTIGISRPEIEKIESEMNEKKKVAEK